MQLLVKYLSLLEEAIGRMFMASFLFRFLKRIYYGLIYFFLWAGTISLHDELFSSTGKICAELKVITNYTYTSNNVISVTSEKKTCAPFLIQLLFCRYTEEKLSVLAQQLFQKRMALMANASECPERHRARLRFSSD